MRRPGWKDVIAPYTKKQTWRDICMQTKAMGGRSQSIATDRNHGKTQNSPAHPLSKRAFNAAFGAIHARTVDVTTANGRSLIKPSSLTETESLALRAPFQ